MRYIYLRDIQQRYDDTYRMKGTLKSIEYTACLLNETYLKDKLQLLGGLENQSLSQTNSSFRGYANENEAKYVYLFLYWY